MKLDDIISMWREDAVINKYELTEESLKIPLLHSKYYEVYLNEKRLLVEQQEKFKNFELTKSLYYQGKLDIDEIKKRGWQQFNLHLLKGDIPKVVEADDDIINYKIKISEQFEKTKFAEDILKSIHQRCYVIKGAIDFAKFQAGA